MSGDTKWNLSDFFDRNSIEKRHWTTSRTRTCMEKIEVTGFCQEMRHFLWTVNWTLERTSVVAAQNLILPASHFFLQRTRYDNDTFHSFRISSRNYSYGKETSRALIAGDESEFLTRIHFSPYVIDVLVSTEKGKVICNRSLKFIPSDLNAR